MEHVILILVTSPIWGPVMLLLVLAISDVVGNPFAWIGAALRSRQSKEIARLKADQRRHLAALKMYESRANWIGSEFTGSDDPTAPARIAIRGEDAERAIKSLPPGRFAARKP